jgi:cell division septal protein FtsQ
MGYKAIDKEIELIQNREYKNFKSIKQELNFLKNEKINFIDYDINLIKVKRLKNIQSILVISILLGLILGIFYVLITNKFQSKISDKK